MKLNVFFIAVFLIVSCAKTNKTEEKKEPVAEVVTEMEQKLNEGEGDLEIYDFVGFEKLLKLQDDKVHVVNFWATWCAPCVKELPYFEKLNEQYEKDNVEVTLVSLDFPHLYEKKLKPFIKDRNLKSKVIALDDANMNSWIPKVDKTWSGSIPATIIYRNNERRFYEQSFIYEELEEEVKHFIN